MDVRVEPWKKLSTEELMLWTVVLEKTLESLLDSKEIKPVNPKGNKSWIFIGRLMLKLKLEYFGHLMWRTDSLEKMLGKIEGRRKRGWQRMRWLNGITDSMDINLSITNLGIGDGQGSLAFCNPWDCKESDTTEWLNWTELCSHLKKYQNVKWDLFRPLRILNTGINRWL